MNDKKVDDAILGYNIIISTVHTLKEKRLLLLFVLREPKDITKVDTATEPRKQNKQNKHAKTKNIN